MSEFFTRSSENPEQDIYNVDAIRRDARKRDGVIHFHSPEDSCSGRDHEKYVNEKQASYAGT